MYEKFEITAFLCSVLDSPRNGRVQITARNVDWCLDICNGRILSAAHSLQYLTTLEAVLPALKYEAALAIYWRLIRSEAYRWKPDAPNLEKLTWTSHIVAGLVRYEALTLEQAQNTLIKLAEDALEAMLGLDSAHVVWHPLPAELWYASSPGLSIPALGEFLSGRQRAWKPVCDRIVSPHQRPYCEAPEELHRSIPQGRLSREMLKSLARLMQGASIRQLAQTIQQDEAKLAELLYPYICQQVIKLWPPIQPLARLPWLPGTQSAPLDSFTRVVPTSSNGAVTSRLHQSKNDEPLADKQSTNEPTAAGYLDGGNGAQAISTKPSKASESTPHSRYLIICIDDSQAMLEQVDSYLDPNQFELQTVLDPVASVSKICAMKPDLVLMDISMPSINGNSLCQILKRSHVFKHVPIIMISGNSSALTKATAESAGATDFLEKPFSKAQLMKILETYLKVKVSS